MKLKIDQFMWLKSIKAIDKYLLLVHATFIMLFYLMNVFTPFNGDDYRYAFVFGSDNYEPINSLSDVITSQIYHYNHVNGRFVPHFLEQSFMGIWGKPLFNVLNSLVYFLFASLLYSLMFRGIALKRLQQINILIVIYIAILYLFAYPGQTELWMDGSFNYMWPMVMALCLIKLYVNEKNYPTYICILIFFLSVLFGWTQEAVVIPIGGGLFLGLLFKKRYRCKKNYFIVLGYLIGAALIAFSPGTLGRLKTYDETMNQSVLYYLFSKFYFGIAAFQQLYVFWTSVLLVLAILVKKKSVFLRDNISFWMILWIFNLVFVLLLGFGDERVTLSLSVFSFVLILKILEVKLLPFLQGRRITFVIITMSLIGIIYACNSVYKYNIYYKKYLGKVAMSEGKNVVISLDFYSDKSRFVYTDCLFDDLKQRSLYLAKNSIVVLEPDYFHVFQKIKHEPYISDKTIFFDLYYDYDKDLYYIIDNEKRLDGARIYASVKVNMGYSNLYQRLKGEILYPNDDGVRRVSYSVCKNNEERFLIFKLPKNCFLLEVRLKNDVYTFALNDVNTE